MATKKATPDLNDVAARALAEKIVLDIMSDGNGKLADRLVMRHGGRDGAGWSRQPLVDRVHRLLTGVDAA